jgi:hypothetical protein
LRQEIGVEGIEQPGLHPLPGQLPRGQQFGLGAPALGSHPQHQAIASGRKDPMVRQFGAHGGRTRRQAQNQHCENTHR